MNKKCTCCDLVNSADADSCKRCGSPLADAPSTEVLRTEAARVSGMFAGLIAGLATSVGFGLGGYFCLRGGRGEMGTVLFILLPVAAGFATAMVSARGGALRASLLLGLVFCLTIFITTGREGLVCVLLALPLIVVGLAIGGLLGWVFKRRVVDTSTAPTMMKMLVLIAMVYMLAGAKSVEQPGIDGPRIETFEQSILLDASRDRAWDEIKAVETIEGSVPFLLRMGLPTPRRCVLEGESVGSKRICYFDSGYIEERVIEWQPPVSMRLAIVDSTLPGGIWLGFKSASYELRDAGDKTLLIRRTTITSHLSPAWYWRYFEGLGVQAEHRYLLEHVKHRLERNAQ